MSDKRQLTGMVKAMTTMCNETTYFGRGPPPLTTMPMSIFIFSSTVASCVTAGEYHA